MSTSGVDLRAVAAQHIRTLELQHRAGLNPSFGQVEDLFDLGRRLGEQAQTESRPATVPERCAKPGCTPLGVDRVSYRGRTFCPQCAVDAHLVDDAARRLGGSLAFPPAVVDWPAGSKGPR